MSISADQNPSMRDILDTFKEHGGENWADTILSSMTEEELQQLKEAIDKKLPKKEG